MGGFQAVAAGLGQTGEELGAGQNAALNEALKVRAQLHSEQMDTSHLALAQAGQQQALAIAQQQHELMRQQMLQSGWTHTGTVKGADGLYYQQFDNPRMPPGQQTSRIPYVGGVPPDSPEGLMQSYKYYANQKDDNGEPLLSHREIIKKVMGLDDLYHQGPAQVIQGFREDAEAQAKKGLKYIEVPGYGKVAIDTPNGQARYAQINADSYWGKGAFLRASMGIGGKPIDMTGWTKQEVGEYKSFEAEIARKEQAAAKFGESAMANSIQAMSDPAGAATSGFDAYNAMVEPLHAQLQAKQEEINARHSNRPVADVVDVISPQGVPGRIPRANLKRALALGYREANKGMIQPGAILPPGQAPVPEL